MRLVFISTLAFILSINLFASDDANIAKAVVVRGEVIAKDAGNNHFRVEKDMWLKEGLNIETSDKSIIKIVFIDKSQMTIGPNSQLVVAQFKKEKAGVISLIRGQVRSKVTKDYMNNKEKNKSKLFIQTRTAVLGVRGTDFQVNFNEENQNTSLITFSGAVAMAKQQEDVKSFRQESDYLEKVVSSEQSVIVKEGQFSGSSPELSRVTQPVKIMPSQLEALKKNEDLNEQAANSNQTKQFRSPLPPGVDEKKFSGSDKGLKEQIGTVANRSRKRPIKDDFNPAGKVDADTGAITPTAGGFVDLKTAQYIAPPKGSVFDAVTQTYIPPSNFGSFDPKTGEYVNSGYELKANGNFIPKEETLTKIDKNPPPAKITIIPQVAGAIIEGSPSNVKAYLPTTTQSSRTVAQAKAADTTQAKTLIEETKRDNQQIINETIQNNIIQSTRSRVRFIIQ